MLCNRCENRISRSVVPAAGYAVSTDLSDSLASLLCARCGTLLLRADPEEALLTKLSQMSRFGLGADDRPLLGGSAQAK